MLLLLMMLTDMVHGWGAVLTDVVHGWGAVLALRPAVDQGSRLRQRAQSANRAETDEAEILVAE